MEKNTRRLRVIVVVFLTEVFLTPSISNAQNDTVSRFYVSPNIEGVHYNLTIYSPNNQTSYSKTIPLDFNLQWIIDRKPTYPFTGFVSYHIDNGAENNIESNQTANDQFASYQQDFIINPSFSYLANISGIENGYHNLVITGTLYLGSGQIFNVASTPFQFIVNNSTPIPTVKNTPSPTPSVPEFPATITITLLAVIALAVAVVVRRKHLPMHCNTAHIYRDN